MPVAAAARLLQDPDGLRSLDRLTALARRLIGSRHVHVAVLTDQLVVASRAGESLGELPGGELHGTLCSLTASDAALLRIEDVTEDVRVREFPVVRSGKVRADLGVPLIGRRGTVIGALCCADTHPHPLSSAQVHDRHAAAAMGQLRNLLRGLIFDHGASPADMLQSVDRAIPALEVDCLATAIVARVEPVVDEERGVRRIRFANAGHVPPAVVRCDGCVELLDTDSCLLLGVDPSVERAVSLDHMCDVRTAEPDGAGETG